MIEKIHTENAPAAIGPYCQAVKSNGFVFTSGQIGTDPKTGTYAGSTVTEQAERACLNLEAVLLAAGSGFDKVIKTTCYLADMNDFAVFNKVYEKYFVSKPARCCVAVKSLPAGALCEIEVIAEA